MQGSVYSGGIATSGLIELVRGPDLVTFSFLFAFLQLGVLKPSDQIIQKFKIEIKLKLTIELVPRPGVAHRICQRMRRLRR